VLERNIRALQERRQRDEKKASGEARLAEAITRFTGSMRFVYLHLVFFGFWILANLGWVPGVPSWDPSFVVLAMMASVEAIFLSTFVLISQNRMAMVADKRADLDLHISLLAEHEITKLVSLISAIADRVGVETTADAELREIKQNVAPEAVLDELEAEKPGPRAVQLVGNPEPEPAGRLQKPLVSGCRLWCDGGIGAGGGGWWVRLVSSISRSGWPACRRRATIWSA
jgi:uncharacterized membrane protein